MNRRTMVLLAIALGACQRGDDKAEPADAGQEARADTAAPASALEPVMPEQEATAVLKALTYAQIVITSIGQDVSQNDDLLNYARVVSSDYRGIAQLIDSAAAAEGQTENDNARAAELRRTGDSIATGLRILPSSFNNTFIEEEVGAHQRALQLMDSALIPSVRTPQLKRLFEAIRPTMAAHLQRGLQLLAERKQAAADRGEPWVSGLRAPQPAPQQQVEEESPDTMPRDTLR